LLRPSTARDRCLNYLTQNSGELGLIIRAWYFRRVVNLSAQVYHQDGRRLPGHPPNLLVGNLQEIYSSKNRLSAYHGFHQRFGEMVQIFWMWRHQVSAADYRIAHRVLVTHQQNFEKFRPNSLICRLYGSSVLTNSGEAWKRQRSLLNEAFFKKNIVGFHNIFVDNAAKLTAKWSEQIEMTGESASLDIYPDLAVVFLDMVGDCTIGHSFGAIQGGADEFLSHLHYVVEQSTRPMHQFIAWWKYLPVPSNLRLAKSFAVIDTFLDGLICRRRKQLEASNLNEEIYSLNQERSQAAVTERPNVLDLLLRSTALKDGETLALKDGETLALSDREVQDNLLAILVNGHETVATSVACSIYLLACNGEKYIHAQTEVDQVIERGHGELTEAGVSELHYLESVIQESLRLYPPMAGLQRISLERDVLEGWSIPARQVIGIPLQPLHLNEEYFGQNADQFIPERYLEHQVDHDSLSSEIQPSKKCPVQWLHKHNPQANSADRSAPHLPLAFGDGARKCLGEHFAMYEMKIVIATLLRYFEFQVAPNFEFNPELGKFGLFISMFPKGGVEMVIRRRQSGGERLGY
jgi:cytochrome P450 family 714 subfamily C